MREGDTVGNLVVFVWGSVAGWAVAAAVLWLVVFPCHVARKHFGETERDDRPLASKTLDV
jgi:hypothetical protein